MIPFERLDKLRYP